MAQKKQDTGASCLLLLVIIIAALVFFGIRSGFRRLRSAPFEKHLSEYASIRGLEREQAAEAYIRGKIVAVNRSENQIDDIYFDLPQELRAAQPEEVGTVVWLEWGADRIGMYTDGAGAYAHTCKVTIIDMSIPAIIAERDFRGSRPPETKSGSGSRYGSKPTDKIVGYLKGLPRKTLSTSESVPTGAPTLVAGYASEYS
jgi:hypothetical protein